MAAATSAAAETPTASALPGGGVRVASRGELSLLKVSASKLWFCDPGGLLEFELPSGRFLTQAATCPPAPPPNANIPEVTVRTPGLGPNDILEIEGEAVSYPLLGHGHDWAADDARHVIVCTSQHVIGIDAKTTKRVILSRKGADRVAIGGGWVAWWDGKTVVARKR